MSFLSLANGMEFENGRVKAEKKERESSCSAARLRSANNYDVPSTRGHALFIYLPRPRMVTEVLAKYVSAIPPRDSTPATGQSVKVRLG